MKQNANDICTKVSGAIPLWTQKVTVKSAPPKMDQPSG
jgi:hypothetical protein